MNIEVCNRVREFALVQVSNECKKSAPKMGVTKQGTKV